MPAVPVDRARRGAQSSLCGRGESERPGAGRPRVKGDGCAWSNGPRSLGRKVLNGGMYWYHVSAGSGSDGTRVTAEAGRWLQDKGRISERHDGC